jgi:hypothetical protein
MLSNWWRPKTGSLVSADNVVVEKCSYAEKIPFPYVTVALIDGSTDEVKQLCGHILLALKDIMATYNEILLGGVL